MRKSIFLLFIQIIGVLPLIAQTAVSGVITGDDGVPLPGVNVVVKGTNIGVVSAQDGAYSIRTTAGSAVLVFSFIGYLPQEKAVSGQQTLNIQLQTDAKVFDEVVVVGYGAVKRVSLTNSVSQIQGTALGELPVSDLQQALQGRLAGVTVLDNGGSPGQTNTAIRVRGITSFNTDMKAGTSGYDLSKNNALIIVDGIEQEWKNINPDDIESVSVLKDASSTAIYGSRGTNGVILVTTKRATAGSIRVDINSYAGWQRANNRPEPMSLAGYLHEQQAAYINAGYGTAAKPLPDKFTDAGIQEYINATDREKYPLPNTWFQTLLHTRPQFNTAVAIAGGNETLLSRLSVRYFKQQGVIDNNGSKLADIRLSNDFKISPKLRASSSLDYRNNNYYYPTVNADQPLNHFFHGSLWAVPKYADGTYGLSTQGNNPLMFIEKGGITRSKNDYVTGNLKAEYQIIDGLTFTSQFGVVYNALYRKAYTNQYSNTDKNTGITKTVANNSLTETRNSEREYTWNNLLHYQRAFAEHQLGILAGYSQTRNVKNLLAAYRERFYNNDVASIGQGANDATKSNSGNDAEYALRSYFGRINYTYAGKYLLEVNGRYDGSSKFTGDRQYGFFPSLSAGWLLSEETFWEPLRATVNVLKLRGSWGITGNQSVDLYSYYPALVAQGYSFGGTAVQGYRLNELANEQLGWESTTQTDFGIETTLLDGNLDLTIDWYKKVTNDILLSLDIPAIIGLGAPAQNAGQVQNKGWEFSINYHNRSDFGLEYSVGGNFNINHNEVTDLKGTGPYFHGDYNTNPYYTIAEGLPINTLWGFTSEGLFQSQEEIDAYRDSGHGFNQGNPAPGDVKFIDTNANSALGAEDMSALGHAFPVYTFGLHLDLKWKNLELLALFQGAADVDVRLAGALAEMGNQEGFAHKIYEGNYWTPEHRDARFPRPVKFDLKNVPCSDRLIIDASYLRLKNLQVAYNVPLPDSFAFKKLRIYAGATNLLTLSKLNEWNLDPEVESGRAVYFPQTSVYSVGINLNF
ncbi:MAG: TonB-dependent receptor [Bacteroidales bacterium]|jgi:TonB-linked SusC/RagA family outer membrane protein|nr:TonB-dependent receptor [Bacteroidales bacterium]